MISTTKKPDINPTNPTLKREKWDICLPNSVVSTGQTAHKGSYKPASQLCLIYASPSRRSERGHNGAKRPFSARLGWPGNAPTTRQILRTIRKECAMNAPNAPRLKPANPAIVTEDNGDMPQTCDRLPKGPQTAHKWSKWLMETRHKPAKPVTAGRRSLRLNSHPRPSAACPPKHRAKVGFIRG